VAYIVTAKEQLDWAAQVRANHWDPAGPEALAAARKLGSLAVKETDDRGNVEFRFGWWMFAPTDRQLQLHLKGCKSTSDYDADKSFLSLTYTAAAVTITNADTVQSICTSNCRQAQPLDCEHVEITSVLYSPTNAEIINGTAQGPLQPMRTDGRPVVNSPSLNSQTYDTLARIKNAANVFDPQNLEPYAIHPDQRLSNSGIVDSAGLINYFVGPGVSEELQANPDGAYRIAGARIVAEFAAFFSETKNQPLNVQKGTRGAILQPSRFNDFSTDIRLVCNPNAKPGAASNCGLVQGNEQILDVSTDIGGIKNPFQVLLFLPKQAGDTNADGEVNKLDQPQKLLDGPCKDDAAKCSYTVTGKTDIADGSQVFLYAGAEGDRYKTKTAVVQGGSYSFTDVFPGVWVAKIDKDASGRPCRAASEVLAGVNAAFTDWSLDGGHAIAAAALDSSACWPANADSVPSSQP